MMVRNADWPLNWQGRFRFYIYICICYIRVIILLLIIMCYIICNIWTRLIIAIWAKVGNQTNCIIHICWYAVVLSCDCGIYYVTTEIGDISTHSLISVTYIVHVLTSQIKLLSLTSICKTYLMIHLKLEVFTFQVLIYNFSFYIF